MTMHNYNNPLSITSQFSFCGLPFRLDTYAGCAIGCKYCFARTRGGNINSKQLKVANHNDIISTFQNALTSNNNGIISQFIRNNVPLHFGGMSDPFQSIEKRFGTSYFVLEYLKSINYPVVVSTKSDLIISPKYLSLLKSYKNLVIQISISTLDNDKSKIIEPNAPSPELTLQMIQTLNDNGVNTTIRWQPYIIGVSDRLEDFVNRISKLNVKHLSFEHLKLPLEKNIDLDNKIKKITGKSIYEEYKKLNAIVDGRELILPIEFKKTSIFKLKEISKKHNINIGFADNEFQYLSDFNCCCSGIDMFNGFENWYKPQISYAIKKAYNQAKKVISFNEIENEWNSTGAIDKFINSKSRIDKVETHNTMLDYVRDRWNNLNSPFNPTKYFNISYAKQTDEKGNKIYKFDDQIF
ncbi:radical SAM protein [Empedobacter brevis]|uniref:radical SAM protein n=1 Tax=Empedobacter brevis TaxID=247 RepID=UPI003340F00B